MAKPIVTQLVVDASGAKTGVAEFERAMDKAKKAAKDGGESTNSFERAQRSWVNSLAKADPAIRAQLQLQRDLEKQQRINTDAVRLGITTQEAANAQLVRVRRLHEEKAAAMVRGRGAVDGYNQSVNRMSGAVSGARNILAQFGLVLGAAGLVMLGRNVLGAFAEFEKGLIGVGKTTNILGAELDALGVNIQEIATRVPIATAELLAIAQSAGQLGVQGADNIALFTETVGKLGLASNLAGEEAATALARILTVTGTAISDVDRLGSTIVELGNNFAATESEIAQFATRVAGAGAQFGVTAAEAAAIGTAMRSLGIEAEAGGSQVGLAFGAINKAIRQGGDEMVALQKITGQTREELAELFFGGSATQVFQSFVEGLGRIADAGGDVSASFNEIGLNGIRADRVFGTMAMRSDVLGRALSMANDEWENNSALTIEAMRAAESFSAQMTLLGNRMNALAADIGAEMAPALIALSDNFSAWIEKARESGDLARIARDLAGAIETIGNAAIFVLDSFTSLSKLWEATKIQMGEIAAQAYHLGRILSNLATNNFMGVASAYRDMVRVAEEAEAKFAEIRARNADVRGPTLAAQNAAAWAAQWDADRSRRLGAGADTIGGGEGTSGIAPSDNDINALENYISKLEEAARLAGVSAQHRELETALIQAANEAQKAINKEQRVTVTTAEQARMILDDSTESRIASALVEQRANDRAAKAAQDRQEETRKNWENLQKIIGSYDDYMNTLRTEVRLAGMVADEREIEVALIQARNQFAVDGLEIDEKAIRNLIKQRQEADKLQSAQEAAIKERERLEKDAAAEFDRVWDQAARNIQDSFGNTWRDIFDNGIDGFKGFGRSIINIFKDVAAQIMALMTFRFIGSALGGAGLGSGIVGQLFGGGAMGGGGFSLAGLGKTWESGGLMGLLGLGGGETAGMFSGAVKGGGAASGLFGTGTSLLGALGGAGMGLGIGSMNLFGGKQTGSTIGGTLGGLAGSFLGPIGSILGSAAGSFIGGLFGAGPSNYTAFADFDPTFSSFSSYGDKPNQNTTSMANAAGNAVLEATKVLRDAGIDFTAQIDRLGIGQRDKSFVDINGKRTFVAGVGDVEGTVKAVLDMLLATATATDESVQSVLKAYQAQGLTTANIDQLLSDIGFAQSLKDLVAANDNLSQWAQAVADVNEQFDAAIDRARELGINVNGLLGAQAAAIAQIEASFTATYGGALDAITAQFTPQADQYTQALEAVNTIYAEAAAEATALGFSLDQIEASANAARSAIDAARKAEEARAAQLAALVETQDAFTGLIRTARDFGREAERMASSWGGAQTALQNAATALLVSDSALSPGARYSAAQDEFTRLKDAALGGDVTAANDLARFASTFLQTSLGFNASSTAYGSDFQMVQDVLAQTADLAGTFRSEAELQVMHAAEAVTTLEAIYATLDNGTLVSVMRESVDVGRATLAALTGSSAAATSSSSSSSTSTQTQGANTASNSETRELNRNMSEMIPLLREWVKEQRMANLEKRHAAGGK